MLRIAAAVALISALAFVSAAAAGAPDCATKGRTVVANAKARVYYVGDDNNGRYYGCASGSDRRKLLGYYVGTSYYQEDTGFFRLRGRRVGYANLSYAVTTSWEAWVVDLRKRKVTRRASASGTLNSLRMTGSGSLALLSNDEGSDGNGDGNPDPLSAYRVTKVERDGGTVLDKGKRIDPDSLAVSGRIVYWTRAGKAYSAPIE